VADYRPSNTAAQKIKKEAGAPQILLTQTDDILAQMGQQKRPGQTLVGFAAETENLLGNARRKLSGKHLDWVVANNVSAEGAGFDGDTNIVTLLGADGQEIALPLMTKREVAERLLDAIRPAS
jgi:phosphopantothenoylcysteine decarboxylase/phosphopantothenate--cysteine ligase